jgi:hypothetical protein
MKKKALYMTALGLLLLSAGCKKSYFDINRNPNNATDATPDLVLSNALTVSAAQQAETGTFIFISGWMGYTGQSGSYATGVGDVASYLQTTNSQNGLWVTYYRNLEDYQYVEQHATDQNLYFYMATAKIMKAFMFQQLVDMFNNIPYTQALQGTTVIAPKYDSAQSVYNAITLQIDTAITLLQRSDATGSSTADVLFGGNNTSWIQFANTLKLRILIRQSQVTANSAFIQDEIAKINANGAGFLTKDAGVNPGYANNAGQQNPVWGFYITLTGLPTSGGAFDLVKGNQYSLNWLDSHSDPRLPFLYTPGTGATPAGTYIGSILGATTNPAGTLGASPGPGILKSVSQPAIILSAAESYFLQAEAIARGWLSGDDAAAFTSGVTASFHFLGAGDPTAYLSQSDNQTNYALCTTLNQKLACIIRQKWIAMGQITPFESYSDYRRLGLPADVPLSISPFLDQSPASIPTRFLYPTSEYQNNTANVNAQGTINYHSSKIFWNQ